MTEARYEIVPINENWWGWRVWDQDMSLLDCGEEYSKTQAIITVKQQWPGIKEIGE